MSKKMMLLATALAALAFAALPAVASAGTPQTHCPTVSGSTCTFEGTSSSVVHLTVTISSALSVTCTQTTTTGTMGTSGGSAQFVFHGCFESLFGTSCTTAGQSTGTIVTTLLPYDNIYPTDNDKSKPGVLITPNSSISPNHFASFSCPGSGSITVSGNGVIGTLTKPVCGATGPEITLDFEQSVSGHQKHKQITGTGTIFDLTSSTPFGPSTAAQIAEGSAKIAGGGSVTVTCV